MVLFTNTFTLWLSNKNLNFQMLRSKYVLLVFGKRMRSSLAFAKLLRPDWWNSLSGPVCEAGGLFRSGPR